MQAEMSTSLGPLRPPTYQRLLHTSLTLEVARLVRQEAMVSSRNSVLLAPFCTLLIWAAAATRLSMESRSTPRETLTLPALRTRRIFRPPTLIRLVLAG